MASKKRQPIPSVSSLLKLSAREIEAHRGEFALFGDGGVDSFYRDGAAALTAAVRKYAGGAFSILRIGATSPAPGTAR